MSTMSAGKASTIRSEVHGGGPRQVPDEKTLRTRVGEGRRGKVNEVGTVQPRNARGKG